VPVDKDLVLERASHALVHGCPEATRLVSVGPEHGGNHGGEERVVFDLEDDRKSKYENFNL